MRKIAFGLPALLMMVSIPGAAHAQSANALWDSAYWAWDGGDFDVALAQLDRLLAGAEGARFLEPAALLTGELFVTHEITDDGRDVRWSPDGRWFAFARGTSGTDRVTHVWDAASRTEAHVVEGAWGLEFSPDGEGAAFIVREDGPGEIRLLDLASGRTTTVRTDGLVPIAVAYGVGGGLFFAAGGEGAAQVYRILPDGSPHPLTEGPGLRTALRPLSRTHLLYIVDRDGFGIVDMATGATREFRGDDVTASADGAAVAWVAEEGDAKTLNLLRPGTDASPVVLLHSDSPLASPALSADGSRVAFQMMPREDQEIYVMAAEAGATPERLTHEIQHDLFPRFLPDGRILAVMGEGRHRRSFLYDPATKARTRLHHNNTVRTVAPEYEWALSADGASLLIVAERDGDTVSPERGVYLMDLSTRVTLDDVRGRVARALAAERALRAEGARTFEPIRADVTSVVHRVSTGRIHEYAADLFAFDSKYITRPGNALAIEYIAGKLRAWGYEPELQWFTVRPRVRTPEGFAQGPEVRTANVIAKLPGTADPDLIYVVSSHFDSVERGPGADDDSSGTSALLEAARVLKDQPQRATIHFAFFTGEEAGLLGSRHYVRTAVERGDRIVGALNNDMVGFMNDHRVDNTIRYSNAGIRDIQHAAAFLFTDLVTYDAKYYKSTDAAAYYEAYGDIVGGIGSYPILGNPHYHQTHDVLETIDQRLVAEVSKTTVATLMRLASSPARLTDLEVTPTGATWAAAAESGVTGYVLRWGPADGEPAAEATSSAATFTFPNRLPAGTVVSVKAVNALGLDSWDRATAVVR